MWKKHKLAGIIAAMICESYHELGKSFPSLCKVSTASCAVDQIPFSECATFDKVIVVIAKLSNNKTFDVFLRF